MPPPPRRSSLARATLGVCAKELHTGFRDRQTALYTLVLPICLYPVLFWVMIQGALVVQGRREQTEVHVALSAAAAELVHPGLTDALAGHRWRSEALPLEAAPRAPEEAALEIVHVQELAPLPSPEAAEGWLRAFAEEGAEDDEPPDALLHLARLEDARERERPPATLFYDSTESRANIAKSRVAERVRDEARRLRAEAAMGQGRDPEELEPFEIEARNVAGKEDMGAFLLSFILPMLLVVMTVMGAFFPAVDLTAGERERHTAETTLLLPIPRLAVHQGKILAVCVSSLIATSLNLFALGFSAEHLMGMLGAGMNLRIEVPLMAFLAITPLALLFAFSVSAVLTGFAALAKSFKEGQAMLGPVQMLFIFPAMAGALPGLELTPAMAFVPVVNVVVAFRSMLRGEFPPLELALTAFALMLYAVLAIFLAVRVLSRETLQLSEETISLRRLIPLLRSSANSR